MHAARHSCVLELAISVVEQVSNNGWPHAIRENLQSLNHTPEKMSTKP